MITSVVNVVIRLAFDVEYLVIQILPFSVLVFTLIIVSVVVSILTVIAILVVASTISIILLIATSIIVIVVIPVLPVLVAILASILVVVSSLPIWVIRVVVVIVVVFVSPQWSWVILVLASILLWHRSWSWVRWVVITVLCWFVRTWLRRRSNSLFLLLLHWFIWVRFWRRTRLLPFNILLLFSNLRWLLFYRWAWSWRRVKLFLLWDIFLSERWFLVRGRVRFIILSVHYWWSWIRGRSKFPPVIFFGRNRLFEGRCILWWSHSIFGILSTIFLWRLWFWRRSWFVSIDLRTFGLRRRCSSIISSLLLGSLLSLVIETTIVLISVYFWTTRTWRRSFIELWRLLVIHFLIKWHLSRSRT